MTSHILAVSRGVAGASLRHHALGGLLCRCSGLHDPTPGSPRLLPRFLSSAPPAEAALYPSARGADLTQLAHREDIVGATPNAFLSAASPLDPAVSNAAAADTASAEAAVSTSELLANTGAEYLQWFHSTLSLDGVLFPWSASLMLSAVAIRLCSLPLVYYNQVHAGRAALAGKELPRVQAFVRQAPGTLLQKYLTFRRLRSLTLRSAGTAPVHLFRWDLLLHLPIVITASMGVRQLASAAPQEWSNGGLAWFPDLTVADPTGVLPLLTTAFWVWNADPKSARRGGEKKGGTSGKEGNRDRKKTNAAIERIMAGRGEWLSTLLQVLAVASLTLTMDLPAGMLVLWASNGAVTAVQRWALSSDTARRRFGLLTSEDIAQATGPPVLQSTKQAIDAVRRELEYVQREVLVQFPNRRVDQQLMTDVNRALKREMWNGRISIQLEAVIREDDRDGKKYIAVVRKGTAV